MQDGGRCPLVAGGVRFQALAAVASMDGEEVILSALVHHGQVVNIRMGRRVAALLREGMDGLDLEVER